MSQHESNSMQLTRRSVVQAALGAFGISALGPVARAAAAAAPPAAGENFLVVVELDGGNDGLNMCVPHGLSNYAAQRPTLGLAPADTLAIDTGPFATNFYKLHPRLPALAQMYRDGEVAIVQKVGYPRPNGSHDTSKRVWAAGQRDDLLQSNGWIGRYAETYAPTALGAVSIGRGRHRSMVGGGSNPLTLGSLGRFQFEPDNRYRANHRHRLSIVRDFLAARGNGASRDAMLAGHSVADNITAAIDNYVSPVTYRTRTLSDKLQDVARLVQADYGTRIYYTGFGGFDTHAAQGTLTGRHADLMTTLDEGLEDLVADLKAMGAWNRAVIVVMSEFGRRNFQNGSGGTDHGRGNFMLVTGGAVRGGLAGPTLTDADLGENNMPYGVDFRSVYMHLLERHLGVGDPTTLFPETLEFAQPLDLML